MYQRARPLVLTPAEKPHTSTAAAAKVSKSKQKHRTGPLPSKIPKTLRIVPSRQPSPKHHSTSPSTAETAGAAIISAEQAGEEPAPGLPVFGILNVLDLTGQLHLPAVY